MKKIKRPRYGLWALIGTIPLIVLICYLLLLDWSGQDRYRYELLHGRGAFPILPAVLAAIAIPFAFFGAALFIDRLRKRAALKTWQRVQAAIVSIRPTGKKLKLGGIEYLSVELELAVDLPGKLRERVTCEHYIRLPDIGAFQPGEKIELRVGGKKKGEKFIIP